MGAQVTRLVGVVVQGDRRGRELGFPTANIEVPDGTELPPDGIYAGWVERVSDRRPAAVSVGTRPTFYGGEGSRLVEAHLLDFDGDLYGETVTVEIGPRVRGQERFTSNDELVARMHDDIRAVRQLIGA